MRIFQAIATFALLDTSLGEPSFQDKELSIAAVGNFTEGLQVPVLHGQCGLRERDHPQYDNEVKPRSSFWEDVLENESESKVVGRSHLAMKKRQTLADVADLYGPWFEGVMSMNETDNSEAFVAAAKNKTIAIVGAGIAGLFTSLLLDSVGMTNWQILESSDRVGGRIFTKYFNNTTRDEYQYQEMGAMRFPTTFTPAGSNETVEYQDSNLVFQLMHTLNAMNSYDPALLLKLIPFIVDSPNAPTNTHGIRLPDGRIPSAAQVAANSSLSRITPVAANAIEAKAAKDARDAIMDLTSKRIGDIATNVYRAHKQAMSEGKLDWSKASYMRHTLGVSYDAVENLGDQTLPEVALWADIYDRAYFSATSWKAVDKGLESLPRAFLPHIKDRISYNRKVSGLRYTGETDRVAVEWRGDEDRYSMDPKSAEYDYAIVSAPFPKVRLWRSPPFSSTLARAIKNLKFDGSCKVALHYQTRFWEHLNPPIHGGCTETDLPGIHKICYPSYALKSSRAGVLLASYTHGTIAAAVSTLSEADHVALVQRAMVEAHGPIAASQFTGEYERKCWGEDEHSGGAWAAPTVGQQRLFLPNYFRTEWKTVFVGEQTSLVHSWVFSALDSAVRGAVQVLLEEGLVGEAKEIVGRWMGRWLED